MALTDAINAGPAVVMDRIRLDFTTQFDAMSKADRGPLNQKPGAESD